MSTQFSEGDRYRIEEILRKVEWLQKEVCELRRASQLQVDRKHFDETTERLLKEQNSFAAQFAKISQQAEPTPSSETYAKPNADFLNAAIDAEQAEPVGDEQDGEFAYHNGRGLYETEMALAPAGWAKFHQLSLYARAYWIAKAAAQSGQRAGVAEDAPDMFWDADNSEQPHDSIYNVVSSAYENGCNVGDVVEVQQAIRLQNIKVRIIADPEDDEEISYEPVAAAPTPAAQGGDGHD